MKFIKYCIYILLSWTFLMISCASNGDTPDTPPPPVVDTVDINKNDYIFGEWEVYYLTKAVVNPVPVVKREFFMDGFTIKFDKNNYTYEERNSLGELNSEGKFEVVDMNKVYLHPKGPDTATLIFKITTLNEKMMVRKNFYKVFNKNNQSFDIEDTQYLRNKNNAPNETFEGYNLAKGKKITPSYFEGKWQLYEMTVWTSTNGSEGSITEYEDKEKYLYNYFTFTFSSDVPKSEIGSKNEGGYFIESSSKGDKILNRGEFVIIDDVLHNYYYEENNEGIKIGRMAPLHINISINGDKNNEQFEDIARTINYNNQGFEIRDLRSRFYKQKTGW